MRPPPGRRPPRRRSTPAGLASCSFSPGSLAGPDHYRPPPPGRQPATALQSGGRFVRIAPLMSSAAHTLILALDVNSREAAFKLVAALHPRVSRFKRGMDPFTAASSA